jgi:hypothetical protein
MLMSSINELPRRGPVTAKQIQQKKWYYKRRERIRLTVIVIIYLLGQGRSQVFSKGGARQQRKSLLLRIVF